MQENNIQNNTQNDNLVIFSIAYNNIHSTDCQYVLEYYRK